MEEEEAERGKGGNDRESGLESFDFDSSSDQSSCSALGQDDSSDFNDEGRITASPTAALTPRSIICLRITTMHCSKVLNPDLPPLP